MIFPETTFTGEVHSEPVADVMVERWSVPFRSVHLTAISRFPSARVTRPEGLIVDAAATTAEASMDRRLMANDI